MDAIERAGNGVVDFFLDTFTSNRLEKQARTLYREIVEKIDRLPEEKQKADRLLVVLNRRDIRITGFWAKFYEDCAAGIEYMITDEKNGETLAEGEMPLHKVPWRYDKADIEGVVVSQMVARHLVTRQNRYGANILLSAGRDNGTTYSSLDAIQVAFQRFEKQELAFTDGSKIEFPSQPQGSFKVHVHYPLPQIRG